MNKQKEVKFISGNKSLFQNNKIGQVIGTGNSIIYEVQGGEDALKQLRFHDSQSQFLFKKEVQLLEKTRQSYHPNLIEYKGSYIIQLTKNLSTHIKIGYIQMERGIMNLQTFINHYQRSLSESQLIYFMKSMLDCFAHLQRIGIAHRDIKPSNILVFNQQPFKVKVCDIGAGTTTQTYQATKERTVTGTSNYLSPELYRALIENKYFAKNNPYKSDMYSLGLVFLQMGLLRKVERKRQQEQAHIMTDIEQLKKKYPNIIGLGKILRKMLKFNPNQRCDFLQIEKIIFDNNFLRKKIEEGIMISPLLKRQKSTKCEILIDNVQNLVQIDKLVSSGLAFETMIISIQNNIMGFNQNQKLKFTQIAKLKYLTPQQLTISIEMCSICDEEAVYLAQGLQKHSQLEHLTLSIWNNNITKKGVLPILKAIQKLSPTLKTLSLKLSSNEITFDQSFEGVFDYSNSPNLTELSIDLGFNTIRDDNLKLICKDIAKCKSVQFLKLELERIHIIPFYFKRALQQLEKLTNVYELEINASNNSLRDQGFFALADFCASVSQLRHYKLIVRNAQLTDKGFTQFIRSISLCGTLQELKINLHKNQLTQKFSKVAEENMFKLSSLKCLDINLSNNRIGDVGAKYFLKSIIPLKQLQKIRINMDHCHITKNSCLYLAKILAQLINLYEYDMSIKHNLIQLKGLSYICAGLDKTKKLRNLLIDLQGTDIGNYGANSLAKQILQMPSLQNVDIQINNCNLSDRTIQNIKGIMQQVSMNPNQTKRQYRNTELYTKIKQQLNLNKTSSEWYSTTMQNFHSKSVLSAIDPNKTSTKSFQSD